MSEIDIANPEQSALWNDQAGRSWAELGDMLDRLLAPFVPLLLDEVEPLESRRILDIGCGAGALTLAAAERRLRKASTGSAKNIIPKREMRASKLDESKR